MVFTVTLNVLVGVIALLNYIGIALIARRAWRIRLDANDIARLAIVLVGAFVSTFSLVYRNVIAGGQPSVLPSVLFAVWQIQMAGTIVLITWSRNGDK